jgi:polysaccharide biosynthesis protein PslG
MPLSLEVRVRVWLSVLGMVVLVLGVPAGWCPASSTVLAQAGTPSTTPADEMALGVIVDTTNPRSMELAREAGFTHAKMVVHWPRLEPRRGRYTFAETSENDLDNVMKVARNEQIKLVIRVDGVPDWAGGSPSKADPNEVEAFYAAVAAHGNGTIVAYEILNEPNLPLEWGGAPSPSGYAAFLKAAYRGVKQGDPAAWVIGGGPSPSTGGAGGTIEDVDFLRGMYAAGARGSMDALGVHNYGGNHEPERDPGDCSICFRRAEVYRQVMVEQGDAETPVWSTEFGWLLDPGRNMGQYDWMRVSAEQQAEYVVRSFKYAQKHWPWMAGLLLSNLDASTSPYHTGSQNGMPWFAILNNDHSPRPAWKAFKAWREGEGAQASRRSGSGTSAQQVPPAPDPAGEASQAAGGGTPSDAVVAPSQPALTQEGVGPATTSNPTAESSRPTPPSAGLTRVRVGKTDGTGANLRERPSADARAIAILMDGTTVEVIGADVQAGGLTWRNVRTTASTTDGVTGWVAAQYLIP